MLLENDVRRYTLYLKALLDKNNFYPEALVESEVPRLKKLLGLDKKK